MDILNMTDAEIDERYLADFIAAWNRNYGGLGGKMTRERTEREAALYPEPHAQDILQVPYVNPDDRLDELWEAKFRAYERDGM